MKLPVIELFYSIQGEGPLAGIPHIFIRVSGCNLRCVFKDSICDTPYSSFEPEKSKYKDMDSLVKDIKDILDTHPNLTHICITGGEPMLYQEGIVELIDELLGQDVSYTIETNGTIAPCRDLVEAEFHVNIMYSVSPKLSTSEDKVGKLTMEQRERHNKTRMKEDVLKRYSELFKSYFKFVYSDVESLKEIEQLVKDDIIDENLIYLMPEGSDEKTLASKRSECVDVCLQKGWNYTDRLQIVIWGTKRGV